MDLSDLRARVRSELDDTVAPYLYPDADIDRALNNAVREVCLRARLLQDDSSAACSIALVADTHTYRLNPVIMAVRAAHATNRTGPLTRIAAERLDIERPGWSADTNTGTPEYLVMDLSQKKVRLYPTPNAAGTLALRVWRSPLEGELMEEDDDEPVIVLPDPEELKHWALYELLNVKDAEKGDEKRAADHLGLFAEKFGDRPSAHEFRLWSTSPLRGVRMSKEY